MWRWRQRFTSLVCLSSLVSLSFTSVTFPSLSKPLFLHFIHLSTLTVHTRDIQNFHKTWIDRQSYFIDLWGAITEMWMRRLRFTSLAYLSSLVSLFFTSVMLCSLSKSLFPHFIDPSTLTAYTRDVWNVE